MKENIEENDLFIRSWNCFTLNLQDRDVNLMMEDDYDTKLLLKFLIFSLRTMDGQRDSGLKLFNILKKQEERIFRNSSGETRIKP